MCGACPAGEMVGSRGRLPRQAEMRSCLDPPLAGRWGVGLSASVSSEARQEDDPALSAACGLIPLLGGVGAGRVTSASTEGPLSCSRRPNDDRIVIQFGRVVR